MSNINFLHNVERTRGGEPSPNSNKDAARRRVARLVGHSSSYPMDVWQFEYFDAESGESLSKFSLNAKFIHRPDAISRVINRVLEDLRKKHKELPIGWFGVTTDILDKVV